MAPTFIPNFVNKTYLVLVDKYTQQSMVSCTICEKERVATAHMIAFKFQEVETAVKWFDTQVFKKAFKPRRPSYHCTHVKYDYPRAKDYPLVKGYIEGDDDIQFLPIEKKQFFS